LLTLRGAVVRDPHGWARYLTEAIDLFGDRTDVAFASHHWPTWGRERVVRFLTIQRDLYAYLHDQTLRLINKGWTGTEIAEHLPLPPALENAWSTHGYYGSVSHNLKAIYQRYMGWFDGNPAHLWQHTPVEQGKRYVEAIGGADAVVDKARAAFDAATCSPTRTNNSAMARRNEKLTIDIVRIYNGDRYRLRLSNGVLSYSTAPQKGDPDLTLTTTSTALPALVSGKPTPEGLAKASIKVDGDTSVLATLASLLDPGDPDFAIVTP
jgi:alkyl sulfatase BDS1-like metallo-beta-lactamase superfamily hydrolase